MKLCGLHDSDYVPMPREHARTELLLRSAVFEFSRTRRVIVGDYCNELILGKETPEIIFENTDDVLDIARGCAQTILANACPEYVAITRHRDGQTKIIKREIFDRTPHLYQQLPTEQQE